LVHGSVRFAKETLGHAKTFNPKRKLGFRNASRNVNTDGSNSGRIARGLGRRLNAVVKQLFHCFNDSGECQWKCSVEGNQSARQECACICACVFCACLCVCLFVCVHCFYVRNLQNEVANACVFLTSLHSIDGIRHLHPTKLSPLQRFLQGRLQHH